MGLYMDAKRIYKAAKYAYMIKSSLKKKDKKDKKSKRKTKKSKKSKRKSRKTRRK